MIVRKAFLVCLLSAALVILAGCSGSFDEATGMYSYKELSLQLPQGWGKIDTTPGALITVGNKEEFYQIDVGSRKVPDGVSLDQFINAMSSNYSRLGRKNGSGEMMIGGIDGYWSDWSLTLSGHKFRNLIYMVKKDDRIYMIICTAAENKFADHEKTFDAVVKSIFFG